MKASACRCARSRRDGAGGFLLTETLATFTISAFVLLGLVSASSVLLRTVDRSVAHVQDVDDLSRTLSAIERDVSGLARARWHGFEPQPFVFRGGPNSLYFAHAQREMDGSSETSVIALREIVAGHGTRLMRGEAKLSVRATGFEELRFGPQRELGTGPARLRFSYIPAATGKVELPRVRTWPEGPALPAAIIIEAVGRDTGLLVASKYVPIRANADIGCLAKDKAEGNGAPPLAAAYAERIGSAPEQGAAPAPGAAPSPPGAAQPNAAQPNAAQPEAAQASFCGRAGEEKPNSDQRNAAGPPGRPQAQAAGPTP